MTLIVIVVTVVIKLIVIVLVENTFLKCDNGLNVPKLFVCVDVDCYDGSDEKNCLY